MKKVISFSLWGDNTRYTVGAVRNAELAQKVYPDWECWFYIAASTKVSSPWVAAQLGMMDNCRVIEVDEEGDWDAMCWRFLPAGDPDVDVMISRDCDSRLWFREKAAVEEGLESDKLFHIMRDNAQHTTPILGGMWGVRGDKLKDIASYIKDFHRSKNYWQMDQEFLRDIVYPLVREDSVVHDEFFEKNPFPYPRDEKHFVGQAYDGNGKILDDDEHFEEFTERDLNGTR